MAEEGGYEIMPYKEIVALKKQIEELRRRTGDTDSKELLASMSNLTKSMNNMLQLFKTAAEEMKLEQREEHAISKKVGPLVDRVNELSEQNKIIAEGMVAIADMVKEMKEGKPVKPFKEEEPGISFKPGPPPIEPVRFVPGGKPKGFEIPLGGPPGGPMPPRPEPIPPPPGGGMPPGPPPLEEPFPPGGPMPPGGEEPFPPLEEPFPPLEKPKKKGLFGRFKK